MFLEKVVKVDEDDFENELGDEVSNVPHSDSWGPDDLGHAGDIGGLNFIKKQEKDELSYGLDFLLLKSELFLFLVDLGVLGGRGVVGLGVFLLDFFLLADGIFKC